MRSPENVFQIKQAKTFLHGSAMLGAFFLAAMERR